MVKQGGLAGRTAGLRPAQKRRLERLCHRRHPDDQIAELLCLQRLASESRELELPLTLQAMAQSGRFDALIALGCVIRGETYHFEIVSNESAAGIMQVQLDTGVPIANGILTTENDEQADVRSTVKGAECAEAAVEMANFSAAASKSMPSKLPS